MNVFIMIDKKFLQVFEKCGCWFQQLTGKNCFWLARLFLCLSTAIKLVLILSITRDSMIFYFLEVVMFSFWLFLIWQIEKKQNINFSNPSKIFLFPTRMWYILTLPITILSISHNYNLLFLIVAIYFASCDVLPYSKSKIREWIENFVDGLKQKQPLPVKVTASNLK